VPAGLDGNADPIVTVERDAVLGVVTATILGLGAGRQLVGVDGRSGVGKSTLADEIAQRLMAEGVEVVRSTTDSFHRPRGERMAAGPTSADGYYRDSHQLDAIVADLLSPFAAGSARVRTAAFDEPTDEALDEWRDVGADAVMVFDGLFLHRPELIDHWSLSVYVEADRRRDEEWLGFLLGDLPEGPAAAASMLDDRLTRARWPRYRDGWQLYLEEVDPRSAATLVVDNEDLRCPQVVEPVRRPDGPDRPGT
jgi:uridine kinase